MSYVSHEKNHPTFHYTGWLIGILGSIIPNKPNKRRFFSLLMCLFLGGWKNITLTGDYNLELPSRMQSSPPGLFSPFLGYGIPT